MFASTCTQAGTEIQPKSFMMFGKCYCFRKNVAHVVALSLPYAPQNPETRSVECIASSAASSTIHSERAVKASVEPWHTDPERPWNPDISISFRGEDGDPGSSAKAGRLGAKSGIRADCGFQHDFLTHGSLVRPDHFLPLKFHNRFGLHRQELPSGPSK